MVLLPRYRWWAGGQRSIVIDHASPRVKRYAASAGGHATAGMAGRSRHMTEALDGAVADPQRTIAELQRQLDERTAERDEALDQQTATAEVLQVINSSPGDLVPVFDAVVDKAMRLCEAAYGHLLTFDGVFFRLGAVQGEPVYTEPMRHVFPVRPEHGITLERLVAGENLIHISDLADTDAYRAGKASARRLVDVGGARSLLNVALRKDGVLLGSLHIYRAGVRPFTEKQFALLENFAAQAVIAMENARLITETREALEQQTAPAE